MGINKELEGLYNSRWDELIKNGNLILAESKKLVEDGEKLLANGDQKEGDKLIKQALKIIPTNPLLLKVDEEKYAKAHIKVMIFGQETWGWHNFATSIEEGMNRYENFFINGKFYKGYKKSSFWKGFNFFKKEINNFYKDKEVVYVWNNISKIGRNDGKTGVTDKIREFEQKHFRVIEEEVKILKPDIVIFFTGDRDEDIKFNFNGAGFNKIEQSNTKQSKKKYKSVANIKAKYLPNKSVRLYHPSFFGGFNYLKLDAINFINKT